jgi:arylsulfatase A-like enzyme
MTKYFTLILTLFFLLSCSSDKNPNVLFIAVDDLNDWVGPLDGYSKAITPNLDKMVDRGVLFTNAHCSQPVCTASRNSLMSGLHPVTTGWYGSTADMKKTYDSVMKGNKMLPEYFRDNGYKTMSVGKIFHSGESDYSEKKDLFWDEYAPHFWNNMDSTIKENGFGYRGHMFYPFPKNGGQLVQIYGEDTIQNHYRPINRFYSLCGGPLDKEDIPEEGMYDEQVADWAVNQINSKHEKPFFLAVGFIRPHVPYSAPRKYFDMYDTDGLISPDIPDNEMSDIPMMGKAIAYGYTPKGGWADVAAKPGFLKELIHSYLACVTFADDQIGKVLSALDQSSYADNTVVMLWSDHGQHLGEKRHFRKQALWEESTRVPLLISYPGMKSEGKRSSSPVSLLDLYPTLTALCGLPENSVNEGNSLLPILDNPNIDWPHYVLSVWKYKNHAVRSENYRYIHYRDGTEELYDHRTDPGEHRNLAGDAEYAEVIKDHKRFLPENDALPAGTNEWTNDKYETIIENWRKEGIPTWLK